MTFLKPPGTLLLGYYFGLQKLESWLLGPLLREKISDGISNIDHFVSIYISYRKK